MEKLKNKIQELQETVKAQKKEIQALREIIATQREEVVLTRNATEIQKHELELMVENLKLAQTQLIQSEKLASVGVLTAGIAHELNNPINFLSGNVYPLQKDLEEVFFVIEKYEKTVEANKLTGYFAEVNAIKEEMDFSFLIQEIFSLLKGIEEGASRSTEIIKGLWSFSRLDDEACQFYDIHEGIDSSLVLLQNQIMEKKVRVHKDYGDFEVVECFPGQLKQVIMNIINNSLQAMEEGKGELFIQTVGSAIGIKIIIKDNGEGMTPEVKEHIFDPFFTTKEVGQGSGLGLSISYGIIEKHKGNIDVLSEPGKGTEFIISLPRTQTGNSI
ncbi:MAG: ATP-binding protein [Bacteroidales bacterium]|nr:ATP-binding protein [Bacteroidales bacterium]